MSHTQSWHHWYQGTKHGTVVADQLSYPSSWRSWRELPTLASSSSSFAERREKRWDKMRWDAALLHTIVQAKGWNTLTSPSSTLSLLPQDNWFLTWNQLCCKTLWQNLYRFSRYCLSLSNSWTSYTRKKKEQKMENARVSIRQRWRGTTKYLIVIHETEHYFILN